MDKGFCAPPLYPGLSRVDTLLFLGVLLDRHLLFSTQVSRTLAQAAQSMYALKVLKSSGLSPSSLDLVFSATLVSRLLYASPAWWGAVSEADKHRLQAALDRAARWGLCSWPPRSLRALCGAADITLFQAVLSNPDYVLHHLLPPTRAHTYNLRRRTHDLQLPIRDKFTDLNFVRRMLFARSPPPVGLKVFDFSPPGCTFFSYYCLIVPPPYVHFYSYRAFVMCMLPIKIYLSIWLR